MEELPIEDLTNIALEKQADILTLHFIGFCPKPIGISNELYEKCKVAFNKHRGQYHWEAQAILECLKEEEIECQK